MRKFFLSTIFLTLLLTTLHVSAAEEEYQLFLPLILQEVTSEPTTPTSEPTTPTGQPTTPTSELTPPTSEPTTPTGQPTTPTSGPTTPTGQPTTPTSEPTTPTSEPTTPTSEPTTPTSEPTTPTSEPTTPTSEPTTPTSEPTTPTSEPTTPTSEPTTPTSEPTTPTIEPTTPTTSPTIPVIPNEDFEAGTTSWILNGPSIINSPTDAHSGSYYVLFGGPGPSRQSMYIELTVTSEAPYLTFWSKTVSSQDKCFEDASYIAIDTDLTDSFPGSVRFAWYDFCASKQHDYRLESLNLTSFVGQTIGIEFFLLTTSDKLSTWSIDDIEFRNTLDLD